MSFNTKLGSFNEIRPLFDLLFVEAVVDNVQTFFSAELKLKIKKAYQNAMIGT